MIWQVIHRMFHKGNNIWNCPECHRTIQFADSEMKIIEQGDNSVGHYGSDGGLSIGIPTVTQKDDDD